MTGQQIAFGILLCAAAVVGWRISKILRAAIEAERARRQAGALLLGHDPRLHIGVIESAEIDEDGTGRAVVRFGKNPAAQSVLQAVVAGAAKSARRPPPDDAY